jgi:hypothetical protein
MTMWRPPRRAAGAIQLAIDGGDAVSITWQVLPYVLLTFGEVLVSATGLEFAYSQAPLSMKGVIMAFWYLSVTVGNLWVLLVNATVRNEAVISRIAETRLTENAFLMFLFAGFALVLGWYARRHRCRITIELQGNKVRSLSSIQSQRVLAELRETRVRPIEVGLVASSPKSRFVGILGQLHGMAVIEGSGCFGGTRTLPSESSQPMKAWIGDFQYRESVSGHQWCFAHSIKVTSRNQAMPIGG